MHGPRAGFVVAVVSLLCAGPLPAQGNRWLREVRSQLDQAHASLTQAGFERVSPDHTGLLNTGEAAFVALPALRDSQYAVIGVCDGDCDALGLLIYNASDYEVAGDRARGTSAVVQLRPRAPERYRVKVVMTECRVNPCWYGVALYRRIHEPRPSPGER